ncbi:perlucin-like protein, partial [Saccostrea echinata]|uniref:perlucin-like protein n=1 Tax=Saccostrea echinata TaxID=191078 RepID=UPI002A810484
LEYSTHCYFIYQTEVRWMEAKSECEARCSHLVEIETKEESDWLAETFVLKDTCPSNIFAFCRAWTGGNDLRTEGRYQWDNANESMAFTNWDSNEPSITYPFQAKDSDRIHLLRNGKWNDVPCSTFCEKA